MSATEFEQPEDPPLQDDDIVITGMSSLMPGCENLKVWAKKLYNKENMVSSEHPHWSYKHPELSEYIGHIPEKDRFDIQYFKTNSKTAHIVDPASKKLMELAHKALFDAGVCHEELSRKSVGVFIALNNCETEKLVPKTISASGIIGTNRAMFANRISYWMNITGPSYTVDAEGCGSIVALEKAREAIRNGQCEAAFVGAASVILHPITLIHRNRAVPQNFDGKTKCYDINADGQTISESISVIYLQKYKDARRVYARLCHVQTSFSEGLDGDFLSKFGYYRDPAVLSRFLNCFYKEAGVSPSAVEYIEGFGSADPETDKSELQAIEEVFCKERTKPLLVGCVASNMGYTNCVSGLNGIIKIIHGYNTGILAGNINCDNPRQDIAGIRDGRIRILTENHPIGRSYTALNNFSICGMNSHVLLQGHFKKKDPSKYTSKTPFLVTISNRHESGVERVLDSIKSKNLDLEELALLRNLSKIRTHHLGRGFGVFASVDNKTVSLCEQVTSYDEVRRPLWFVYSGMGSQWTGMGAQLMSLPLFAASIQQCDKILKPKGIDLVEIITSNDETTFDNILNSFVGITAIQIALTDVLKAVGLTPDKIIGHSLGEIGCAYADKCLTAEQSILLAYSRGLVSKQIPFIKGSMAAVGLGNKEVSKMCPPEIEVACHNGPDSSTLSGPAEIMEKFVNELTAKGIFAKEVQCSNIAYHSRYIAKAGPVFLKLGQAIINKPKLRSKRWLSTSVPVEDWKRHHALYSSAEYHTNNLLNSVLFEETSRHIPNGALLVEIAPHGLLQAILKRSLSPDCRIIPLCNRGHPNSTIYLLEALGKLYNEGCGVDTSALYPKVEFPVSTETPQLSHLVQLDHTDRWNLCLYTAPERRFAFVYKPTIALHEDEQTFLRGSILDGKRQFPFAGILLYVWDTLAMSVGEKIRNMSVQFQDVRLYYQPILDEHRSLEFTIMLLRGSGRFEVFDERNILIAEGHIEAATTNINSTPTIDQELKLTRSDIYKLFHERGYGYAGELRSIKRANCSLTKAEIAWAGNWTTFIDGIFQLMYLRHGNDGISLASYIKKMDINIQKHNDLITGNKKVVEANFSEIDDTISCGGVQIQNLMLVNKPARLDSNEGFKALKFVPFNQENNNVLTNMYVTMQIVAKQLETDTIKVLTINDNPKTDHLTKIDHLLRSDPIIYLEVSNYNEAEVLSKINPEDKPDLVIINNEISNKKLYNQICQSLHEDAFVLMLGVDSSYIDHKSFKSILTAGKDGSRLELFKFVKSQKVESVVFSVKQKSDLADLQKIQKDLSPKQTLTVVTTYPPMVGVKEDLQRLRADNSFQTNLAMIRSRKLDIDLRKLHHLDLNDNVFLNGKWGGEYYVPVEEVQTKLENATLQIDKPGDFNSVHWVEKSKDDEDNPITIHYAGLNVQDAKRANAEISRNKLTNVGMDFSGTNKRKERVMGLVHNGSACNVINFKSGLLWPVPDHWSLEDAATVPLPYCMAFYFLKIKLNLIRGTNILIHGGAGALGQAAISIALAHDCKVFTTVSDSAKKRFLRELFPNLPDNHIGNSRDASFRDLIQIQTQGQGCDIIISNVEGKLKNATLACCAILGTTLDVVQIHDRENYEYGLSFMTKGRSYCLGDFSAIFDTADLNKLQWMVSDGISEGYVRPLSRVTYAPTEVPRALRLLAASRHRGRVLLHLKDQQLSVHTKIINLPESSYLIICDKEGFGLKLADRLVSNGARRIHLHLPKTMPHLLYKQQLWKKSKTDVTISMKKVKDNDNLEVILKEMNEKGTVDGIFVIQDDASDEILFKVDSISKKLCPSLRYFVIVNGSHNARYICQRRSQNGLPGVSLNISLKKFSIEADGFDWNNAVDVIEKVVQAKEPAILAFVKYDTQKSIIEEINEIPGVRILNSSVDRTPLEKIGIDYGRSQELCKLLENKFNIRIAKEIVPSLTIGQIKSWQEHKITKKDKLGIGGYFKYIFPDELTAITELVLMPSLLNKADLRSDEMEIEDNQMFIVPGLEGHHSRFEQLCKRLKIATAVMQLGYDNPNETIQETAQRFANIIMHKLKYNGHFYLLGYEYGVLIVIEIAAILESYGLTGTVFCLGGAPEELRANIDNCLDGITEEKLQNELILHFFTLTSQGISEDFSKKLTKLQNFNDKVQLCMDTLRGRIPFNSNYLGEIIKSSYARIGYFRRYKSDFLSLKAKIILIRTQPLVECDFPFTASYELPVSIPYALDELECSAIINRHLEPLAKENFRDRNICHSYLSNDDKIYVKLEPKDFQS